MASTAAYAAQAHDVLPAFGKASAHITAIAMGHINATYAVDHASGAFVLQRVNPMFPAEVNHDIAAIVSHLQANGVAAPTLQPTTTGALWHQDDAGGIWRLMTRIEGHAVERCTSPAQCRTVGTLLGKFHRALKGVEHTFCAPRLGVHDTDRHMARLRAALGSHHGHLAFHHIEPLAKNILQAGHALPSVPRAPERIVHGDPKISNFIFDAQHEAVALIDLDTLASMPIALEMGDALRSWCSPGGEDPAQAGFELSHFTAAIEGYAQGAQNLLLPEEVRSLGPALGIIATELAARFATDALEERYFGWDDSRYSSAWEHNLERAKSQWILAQSFARQAPQAEAIIGRVFGLTG